VESPDSHGRRRCRIVIQGRLSERLGSAFPEMALDRRPGRTVLHGTAEPARLEALLDRIRDLGLDPLSVDVED